MTIYLNNQEFDFGYFTKTTQRVIHITQRTVFKGYARQFKQNSNGDYNHNQNFFIWKRDGKNEYIRICLSRNKNSFHWLVDFSFKPSNYKHNHKPENHYKTLNFLGSCGESYYKEFEECLEIIKGRIKENG